MRKRNNKAEDREIDLAFRATCSGIPIKLMDIPRVFAEGRRLLREQNADQAALRAGILAFVQQITVSP